MQTNLPPVIGIIEVCKRANRAQVTIKRWWEAGLIPTPIKVGGVYIWAEADIDAALAERKERKEGAA